MFQQNKNSMSSIIGPDLEINGEKVRYELEKPMKEPREVRKVMVSVARKELAEK